MFGLSNNKQVNQDDQVMLKNVSKLATDLNSGNASSQTSTNNTQVSDDSSKSQPVVDPGFMSQPAQSQQVSEDASQTVDAAPPKVQETQESVNNQTSSFSFPAPPTSDQADTSSPTEESPADVDTNTGSAQDMQDTPDQDEPVEDSVSRVVESPQNDDNNSFGQQVKTSEEATPDTAEATEQVGNNEDDALPSVPSTSQMMQESGAVASSAPIDTDKLHAMKQQAMEHLDPLVEHLDQSPEETFKTTMMMIQANDNHLLLEKALEAAKQISDDKERAQAMLDIINEINYFSQNSQDS